MKDADEVMANAVTSAVIASWSLLLLLLLLLMLSWHQHTYLQMY